jgi:hypothetical protein
MADAEMDIYQKPLFTETGLWISLILTGIVAAVLLLNHFSATRKTKASQYFRTDGEPGFKILYKDTIFRGNRTRVIHGFYKQNNSK